MDTLAQLQQNRRIIHDFTLSTLAPIPTAFGRLAYLASLRDLSTNVYEHASLTAYYPLDAVRQALEQCHEELFERILETPLTLQEEDLRRHLSATQGGLRIASIALDFAAGRSPVVAAKLNGTKIAFPADVALKQDDVFEIVAR